MNLRIAAAMLAALALLGTAGQLAAQPAPAPELKKLDFFVGEAAGKGKTYLPGQPPMDWTSTDRGSWVMGGQFLRLESKVQYTGGPTMEALILIGYDPAAKTYRGWTFLSESPVPLESTGAFEGTKLVFTGKPIDLGMGATVLRLTFEPKSKAETSYLMEMKVGNTPFQKFEDGTYGARKP
jgi:hypothetical protein